MAALRRVQVIEDPRQIRALASPARQEIVDALAAAGPCSVAELARHVARPADSLYFHLRKLISVGLVVERQARKNGRHVASVYGVLGAPRMRYKAVEPAAVSRVIAAAVRLGGRDFARALNSDVVKEGPRRELWGGRAKGWLAASEVAEANRLIARLSTLMLGGRPGRGRKAMTFTWVLAPAATARAAGVGAARERNTEGGST